MDFVNQLASLAPDNTVLAPCGCGREVHFCTTADLLAVGEIDEGDHHDCHMLICSNCGTFDLADGADPDNQIETLEELRAAIIPVWNKMVRANKPIQNLAPEVVLQMAMEAGMPVNLQRHAILDFSARLVSAVTDYMILEGKKQLIESCGFGIYEADGHYYIASSKQLLDGFFVDSNDLHSAINTTYNYLNKVINNHE